MGKYNQELIKSGVMLAGEALYPTPSARVMFDGKQLTVTDGLLAVGQAAPAAADHALDVQCEWTSVGRPASAPNAHLAKTAPPRMMPEEMRVPMISNGYPLNLREGYGCPVIARARTSHFLSCLASM
jgi:hypothetical protein